MDNSVCVCLCLFDLKHKIGNNIFIGWPQIVQIDILPPPQKNGDYAYIIKLLYYDEVSFWSFTMWAGILIENGGVL